MVNKTLSFLYITICQIKEVIKMFTLQDCYEYVEKGLLTKHESTDGKLVGFKYSLDTVYGQKWDEITLSCRGIAFEKETGKIVAWPFNKFFNYQEIYAQDGSLAHIGKILNEIDGWRPFTSKQYTIAEKVDGSLGIAYFYEGEWHVKTGGSFNSDQAIWATNYLRNNLNTFVMLEDVTYCFEIVYKADPHVVHYDKEELVLLSAFDTQKHDEVSSVIMPLLAKELGCRYVKEYHYSTLEETLEAVSKMDVNHEGVVMTFYNSYGDYFKVKIKSEEYLEMFHRMSCITYKEIRDHFNEELGIVDPEYAKTIPEELTSMKEYVERINTSVATKFIVVVEIGEYASKIEDARTRYEYVSNHAGALTGATMAYIKMLISNGKKSAVYHSIFQRVKTELKEE